MSTNQRPPAGSGRKPMKSQKLNRTLQELESAFTDWEALGTVSARAAKAEEDKRKAKETTQNDEEFRKKTKKLLSQLRQQLSELND